MGCVLHLSYSISTHLQPPVFYPMPGRKHRPTAQIVHLCVSISFCVCLSMCAYFWCMCLSVCLCLFVCVYLFVPVCLCVCNMQTHRDAQTYTHMLTSSVLHLIFLRQSLSLNLELTNSMRLPIQESGESSCLCPPRTGITVSRCCNCSFPQVRDDAQVLLPALTD